MSGADIPLVEITPQVLLKAYACGIFPMAESAEDQGLFWVEPEMRGILPLDSFHVPRSLRRRMRRNPFDVRINHDFKGVVAACAKATPDRPNTWINRQIRDLYTGLHEIGHCHSVECYDDSGLVGGLYGVQLGAAFFGESMFSRRPDASKIALVHLIARLRAGRFQLLDTQFTTEHLKRFGAIDVPREEYQRMLEKAVGSEADFFAYELSGGGTSSDSILQSLSQIS